MTRAPREIVQHGTDGRDARALRDEDRLGGEIVRCEERPPGAGAAELVARTAVEEIRRARPARDEVQQDLEPCLARLRDERVWTRERLRSGGDEAGDELAGTEPQRHGARPLES